MSSSTRRLDIAFSLVLATLASSVFGQISPTQKTSATWVVQEIETMKVSGLLVGYPQKLLGEGRSPSRIELALATYAAWAKFIEITDQKRIEIDEILSQIEVSSTPQKLDQLRSAITAMEVEVEKLQDQKFALKRLIEELRAELSMAGADSAEMHKAINALERRLICYETWRPFDVHGSVNFVGLSTYASSKEGFGISLDGRPLGWGRGKAKGNPVGGFQDTSLFVEGDLEFTTNNEIGPRFVAQFAIGNMLGSNSGFGDQGSPSYLTPLRESNAGWYAGKLFVDYDTSIGEVGLGAKVGRVGYRVNGMMFKRPDTSPYFRNELWDDGDWTFDGAILGLRFGANKLTLFGGVNGNRIATNNVEFQPMLVGRQVAELDPLGNRVNGLKVDQTLGAHLWLPLGDRGEINLAFLSLTGDAVSTGKNTPGGRSREAQVYGGEFLYMLGGKFSVKGGFAKSDLLSGSRREVTKDNQAWWASLKFGGTYDRPFLSLGYRSIDPLYAAPGIWSRVGTYWNPVDLEGLVAEGGLELSQNLKLNAFGALLTGRGTSVSSLGRRDRAQTLRVGLDYWVGSGTSLFANFETNQWHFHGGGSPSQNWYTFGVDHSFANSWNLKFFWQMSDAKADGDERFQFFGQERARGGLIGTQLTLRY